MQPLLFVHQRTDLHSVRDRLGAVFGKIRGEQRWDPTSQFVRACIASLTYDEIWEHAFRRLAGLYRNWDDIADAASELQRALKQIRTRAVMAAADGLDADDLDELRWYLKYLGQKTCTKFRALCVCCPLSDMCMKRVEKNAIAVTRLRRAETMTIT
jgi:endonuclease III